jgi:hypothetical protein
VRLEGLGQLEKSNGLIENRTRDFPASSIMPQPTTLPRAPYPNREVIRQCTDSSKQSGRRASRYSDGLDGRGSIPGEDRIFLYSTMSGPTLGPRAASYEMGRMGLFPRRKSDRDVKLTAHLYPVPRSRMADVYLHSPLRLHGVELN